MFRHFLLMACLCAGPGAAANAQEADAQGANADKAGSAEDWAVHGQATFIEQYHPAFRSAFRGLNSLDPGSRGDETVNATLYAGARPWDGGEAWADGEIDQGFGLSDTLGLAGFSNGEGSKVGKVIPYFRLHRLFLRQSFDLGGDAQDIAPDANQLGGTRSSDNLVMTLGKFSVTDIFDTNKYAHNPMGDFLNWAVVDAGAFDFAADAWGYTYGGAAEWTEGDWTMRAGLFDMSRQPNGTELVRGFGQYQIDAEVERRFILFGQDGAIRLLGFMSRARLGSYKNAVALADATHEPANTVLVEKPYSRPGASLNLEQALGDDLGVFLRLTDTDGSVESYEYTDMDSSLEAGLSLEGGAWSRPDDTAGVVLESGALSRSGYSYLAAGGLGILIGDGHLLHAANENLMETFYSFSLGRGFTASADYQLIIHPAYNRDRGPVSVLGVRLHGEF